MREHGARASALVLPLAAGSSSVLLRETWKASSFHRRQSHSLAFMYFTAVTLHFLWTPVLGLHVLLGREGVFVFRTLDF